MIYLTFAGNHDDIKADDTLGPMFNIYVSFKDDITDVFIFVSPMNPKSNVNYQKIAEKNRSHIQIINPKVKVNLIPIDFTNPVEFNVVYPRMLLTIQEIIRQNKIDEHEKIINISSGTPTMSTCWVLLQQSGIIKNTKLVQSFEPKYARERGKSYQIVEFPVDDFPNIKAPETLKTELTVLKREKEHLAERVDQFDLDQSVPLLIGHSKAIREVKEQIIHDLDNSTHVLIIGEKGTGKEVVAQSIWQKYKNDSEDQLISRDCGAFPKELIRSELFGHMKGAFTGADSDKIGIVEECNNKMLFLDEIGNLHINDQQSLLRYLSSGQIQILNGGAKLLNTQIIAATNKDITDETIFAQDLKDRFDEIIYLPPLRDRKEDIPDLIEHFLKRSTNPILFKSDLINFIISQDWPDNIRGLEKWIKRIIKIAPSGGQISKKDVPDRYFKTISVTEEDIEDTLPDLPLPVALQPDYVELIRQKARRIAGGKNTEVDRLLKQNPGVEKQRQHNKRKK
jgi:DNA-binding NtrC family response regulator